MSSGHTPGPWRLGNTFESVVADHATNPGHRYEPDNLQVYGGHLVAESICNEGNRRLIAAAPELLAACEAVIEITDTGYSKLDDSTIEAIYRAVARARGEST